MRHLEHVATMISKNEGSSGSHIPIDNGRSPERPSQAFVSDSWFEIFPGERRGTDYSRVEVC